MKFMDTINELQAKLTKLRREVQRSETGKVEEPLEDQIRRCTETFIAGYRKKLDQEIMDKLKKAGSEPLNISFRYPYRINKAIIDSAGYPSPEILNEIAKIHRETEEYGPHPDECCGGWYHDKIECTKPDKCKLHRQSKRCKKCGRTSEVVKLAQACPFCDPPWLDDCKRWMDKVRSNTERRALGGKPTPDLPLYVKVAVIMGWRHCSCNGIDDWMGYAPNLLQTWSKIPDFPNDLVAAMGALEEYCDKNKLALNIYRQVNAVYRITINHSWVATEKEFVPQAICEAIVAHSEGK